MLKLRQYQSCDAQAITGWIKNERIGHLAIRFTDEAR